MQRTFMVSNGHTFKPNGLSSARIVSYLLAARNFVQITFKLTLATSWAYRLRAQLSVN